MPATCVVTAARRRVPRNTFLTLRRPQRVSCEPPAGQGPSAKPAPPSRPRPHATRTRDFSSYDSASRARAPEVVVAGAPVRVAVPRRGTHHAMQVAAVEFAGATAPRCNNAWRGVRLGHVRPSALRASSRCKRVAVRPRTALQVRAAGSGNARGLLTEPWDAAPQNWRRFWATKLAAAVVESDQVAETVTVRPVEMSGLEWPPSLEEAQKRVRTNSTLYRQNYVCCALACLAAGAIRHVTLLAALACAAAAAVVTSDRLLGELSLATDGQLVWNAKRVAGVDRAVVRSVLPCAAFLCLALSPVQAARWLVTSLCTAALLSLLHAAMRPIDLEAVVGSFFGDLASSKTRCVPSTAPCRSSTLSMTRARPARMSAGHSQLLRKACPAGGRIGKLRLRSPRRSSSWSVKHRRARRSRRRSRHRRNSPAIECKCKVLERSQLALVAPAPFANVVRWIVDAFCRDPLSVLGPPDAAAHLVLPGNRPGAGPCVSGKRATADFHTQHGTWETAWRGCTGRRQCPRA